MIQPIRKQEDRENMFMYLEKQNPRDAIMFVLGTHVGLRASDLLQLKAGDFRKTITHDLVEKKTKKNSTLYVNQSIFNKYIKPYIADMDDNEYLFQSRKGYNKPIVPVQAYRILRDAGKAIKLPYKIGSHTMRKTFGYILYQQTRDIELVKICLNHSSIHTTERYIGLNEEMRQRGFEELQEAVNRPMKNFENKYRKHKKGKELEG